MTIDDLKQLYDFTGRTIAVTGGAGVLGAEIAKTLINCGANVAVLDLNQKAADELFLNDQFDQNRVMTATTNVLETSAMEEVLEKIVARFGKVDCLINGAGGNNPKATTSPELSFFNIPADSFKFAMELNLVGTVIPSQVFGKHMAENGDGHILNISSMSAFRPLTRVSAYSAAKAAVSNFTQWLAVHLAQDYAPAIRVNAIAPGFFLTNQNRFLLTDEKTGELTERGKQIIAHTPAGRFGSPEDLLGTVLWLLSPASAFVTGIVVPIDGGFSAYSGV